MKSILLPLVCAAFCAFEVRRLLFIIRSRRAFCEGCAFVARVKSAVRYSSLRTDAIAAMCDGEKYEFFHNDSGTVIVTGDFDGKLKQCLESFVSLLGTTDREAQLDICDEYARSLETMREHFVGESASRSKVCAAVVAMCAVCCAVLML